MKNLSVVFALAFLLITASAAMAATTTSPANAQILTSATISNTAPLEFGRLASGLVGTVTISTGGVRGFTGGVTLATGTTPSAAAFDVTGDSGATYTITLPTTDVTITDLTTDTLVVNNFSSSPTSPGTFTGGTDVLSVGAILQVPANSPAGAYTGNFSVSVDYN